MLDYVAQIADSVNEEESFLKFQSYTNSPVRVVESVGGPGILLQPLGRG